jgi:nucleoside-diphosphate-sugar epimerase
MPAGLLLPDLIARCREEGDGPIRMRGQDSERDFLDIRDAVDAYARLCTAAVASGAVFNLCSGRPVRISALVAEALKALGLRREVIFEQEGADTLVGSNDLLRAATGWQPARSLEDLVSFAVSESLP